MCVLIKSCLLLLQELRRHPLIIFELAPSQAGQHIGWRTSDGHQGVWIAARCAARQVRSEAPETAQTAPPASWTLGFCAIN